MSARSIRLEGLLFAPPAAASPWDHVCDVCGGAIAFAPASPSGCTRAIWYHTRDVDPAYAHPSGERGYWDHRATPATSSGPA